MELEVGADLSLRLSGRRRAALQSREEGGLGQACAGAQGCPEEEHSPVAG